MFFAIIGFGLGSCFITLFNRISGGLYSAFLASKILEDMLDLKHQMIVKSIGINIGEIGGKVSDLFSSISLTVCSALYISSTSTELVSSSGYLFPLIIISLGIAVSFIIYAICLVISRFIENEERLNFIIRFLSFIGFIIFVPLLCFSCLNFLPNNFSFGKEDSNILLDSSKKITSFRIILCPLFGLCTESVTSFVSYFYTSNSKPLNNIIKNSRQGSAINIILGLSLGYYSSIIPSIMITLSLYASFKLVGFYGIALCALGYSVNLPYSLAMNTFTNITFYNKLVVDYLYFEENINKNNETDSKDSNDICSKNRYDEISLKCKLLMTVGQSNDGAKNLYVVLCTVYSSFSLLGVYVIITNIKSFNVLDYYSLPSLLLGGMIPYIFTALNLIGYMSVLDEIKKDTSISSKLQLYKNFDNSSRKDSLKSLYSKKLSNTNKNNNEYNEECDKSININIKKNQSEFILRISTVNLINKVIKISLKQFAMPACIVFITPLIIGIVFGEKIVLGFIFGIIISGIQFTITCFNSASVWGKAKTTIDDKGLSYSGVERIHIKLENIASNLIKANKELKILNANLELIDQKNNDDLDNENKEIIKKYYDKKYIIDSNIKMLQKDYEYYKVVLDEIMKLLYEEIENKSHNELSNSNIDNKNQYYNSIDEYNLRNQNSAKNNLKMYNISKKRKMINKSYLKRPINKQNLSQIEYENELHKRNAIYEYYKTEIFNSINCFIYNKCKNSSKVGNSVGEALRLVAGPPVGVLIKNMCAVSVCFGAIFIKTGFL